MWGRVFKLGAGLPLKVLSRLHSETAFNWENNSVGFGRGQSRVRWELHGSGLWNLLLAGCVTRRLALLRNGGPVDSTGSDS